jgi:hypothetical protein
MEPEDYTAATEHQEKEYDSEMEYRGEAGKAEAEYTHAAALFGKTPNAFNWVVLTEKMAAFQNIRMNCNFKAVNE